MSNIFSFTIMDADGEITAMQLYAGNLDALVVTNVTNAQQNAELLDAMIDGQIVKARIMIDIDISGWTLKSSPVANSEIERTGLFTNSVTGSPYAFSVDVPTQAASTFVNNEINTADPDVSAWLADLITGNAAAFGNKDDLPFAANLRARKTFRKHRRQTLRT